MTKRLFVGNLAYTISEAQLESAFAEFGPSNVSIPTGPDGRAKGFAFVEVAGENLDAAIETMHGKGLGGRTLTVNEARPRPERRGGAGDRGASGGGDH